MKILFLDTHPAIRGPLPKILPVMATSLEQCGCEVIARPWGQARGNESLLAKLVRGTRDLVAIAKCLTASDFDVLFVNTAHDPRSFARDIPLLLSTRFLGKHKTVILFHGSQAERLLDPRARALRLATAWMLRYSAGVFLLSTEEERAWRQFYPRGRYYVVRLPNVTETDDPGPVQAPAASGVEVPLLLFAGRVIREKGVIDLIESMPTVLSQVKCRLVIAGDGADRERAERRACELDLGDAVMFAGYRSGADLQRAYQAASVFVLPTYFAEGFPVVVIEAMAAGLPIVTTRTRGLADWLNEPTNALFVPPRDPKALGLRIIELLSEPSLMASMGISNRKLVNSFDPRDVAGEWHRALARIAGPDGRA